MSRPKLTFEQRQEYEELLSKVAVKAERDRLERDMADLSTARVDQFRREVEQLKGRA